MTSLALARSAYSQSNTLTGDPRRVEYAVFARVTNFLVKVNAGKANGIGMLASAIHDNRRLWISIASLVAEDENELPKDLRARLFYLSEFVSHHSQLVLNGKADVLPLIEINQAVMAGLNMRERT